MHGWLQVTLRSTDPSDTPVVNTNIFGEAGEAEQMAACLRKERDVIDGMPAEFQISDLSSFGATITADAVRDLTPVRWLFSKRLALGTWSQCCS